MDRRSLLRGAISGAAVAALAPIATLAPSPRVAGIAMVVEDGISRAGYSILASSDGRMVFNLMSGEFLMSNRIEEVAA